MVSSYNSLLVWLLVVAYKLYFQVVTAPMSTLNAIAVEAYKKYILVSLIHHGQVTFCILFCFYTWHGKIKALNYNIAAVILLTMISFSLKNQRRQKKIEVINWIFHFFKRSHLKYGIMLHFQVIILGIRILTLWIGFFILINLDFITYEALSS